VRNDAARYAFSSGISREILQHRIFSFGQSNRPAQGEASSTAAKSSIHGTSFYRVWRFIHAAIHTYRRCVKLRQHETSTAILRRQPVLSELWKMSGAGLFRLVA
jgi:hypothetical protein